MGKGGSAAAFISALALLLAAAAFVLVVIIWADGHWVKNRVKKNEPTESDSSSTSGSGSAGGSGGSGGSGTSGGSGGPPAPSSSPHKTYVFGFENGYLPHNFINDRGELRGAMLDLTVAICRNQNKQCRFMHVGDASLCWNSENNLGEGIAARYFDGCINWLRTRARDNVFAFSNPILNNGKRVAVLFYKTSKGFTEIGSHTVGFVESAYTDVACLRSSGAGVDDSQVKLAASRAELEQMLRNDEVDFAFSPSTYISSLTPSEGFSVLPSVSLKCQLSGSALMTSKANQELISWFNAGLSAIRESGEYSTICSGATGKYGRQVEKCL